MELFLNLSWVAVAVTILCLWFQDCRQADAGQRSDRRRQLIAILVLITILFPVISVSDDLVAVQNPSESDSFVRRHHLLPLDTHPVPPVLAAVATLLFAGLGLLFLRLVARGFVPPYIPLHPALAAIDNRPPPAL